MGGRSEQMKTKASTEPIDVQNMKQLLKSMGVTDYEPRVVNMLMEFMHTYVSDTLTDASTYAGHASREDITPEDIKLAVDGRLNDTFTQPPPREFMMEIAHKKNQTPLPLFPRSLGVHLPPEKYRLTAANYQVDLRDKARRERMRTNRDSIMYLRTDAPPTQPEDSSSVAENAPGVSIGAGLNGDDVDMPLGQHPSKGSIKRKAPGQISVNLSTEHL